MAAKRSSRLAQPPKRPRARSATSSRKQAIASKRRMRRRHRVQHDRPPAERLDLEPDGLDASPGAAPARPAPRRSARACPGSSSRWLAAPPPPSCAMTPRTAPARARSAGPRSPAPSGALEHDVGVEELADRRGEPARRSARPRELPPLGSRVLRQLSVRACGDTKPGNASSLPARRSASAAIRPTGAAASRPPSACRTASSTTRSTAMRSRKRTSSLAGWTLTSTSARIDIERSRMLGRSPGMDRRAIARLRGAHQERIAEGPPVDEELRPAPVGARVAGALGKAHRPGAAPEA